MKNEKVSNEAMKEALNHLSWWVSMNCPHSMLTRDMDLIETWIRDKQNEPLIPPGCKVTVNIPSIQESELVLYLKDKIYELREENERIREKWYTEVDRVKF